MKRFFLIVFLLFFSCTIKEKGKVIVGVDEFFPPMTFVEDGKLKGIDIDMAKLLFKRIGYKVEFKKVIWKDIIIKLTNKEIDLIWSGLTVNDERKKVIDFSIPYIETKQVIVVNYNSKIEIKDDLKSKIVGVQKGSTGEAALEKEIDLKKKVKKIIKYEKVIDEIKDLEDGKIDAIIIDEIAARFFLSKKYGSFKILAEHLGYEIFAIGLRKEDKKLKEQINRELTRLMNNGEEAKIFKKWLGENKILADYLKRLKN